MTHDGQPETPDERIRDLELRLTRMEASRGKVDLTPSALALVLSVLAMSVSAVVFVVRLDAKMTVYTELVATNQRILSEHVQQPGHATSMERLSNLKTELDNHVRDDSNRRSK